MPGKECTHYWMRPMGSDDIPTMARWFEHLDDLAVFDRHAPIPPNAEAMLAAWREDLSKQEPRKSYWFTIDDDSGEVVGIAGLQSINYVHGDAVLPVYIAEPQRRRGIGIRACAMLLDLAFDHLRLTRVTSYYRADNEASRRMTEMIGFSEEGRLRQAWYADGQHADIVVIGLLRQEWLAQREELAGGLSTDTAVVLGRTPWGARAWPSIPSEQLRTGARA